MSTIRTSSIRRIGLDHFEPDTETDPRVQRRLRGQLEQIDYTAFAANREIMSAALGAVTVEKFQHLAVAAAHARAAWVKEALAITEHNLTPEPDKIAKLETLRCAFSELTEAYEGLRRMVERNYVSSKFTEDT